MHQQLEQIVLQHSDAGAFNTPLCDTTGRETSRTRLRGGTKRRASQLRRTGAPAGGYSRFVLELGAALGSIALLTLGLRLIVLWANDVHAWKHQEPDQTDWP